MNDVNQTGEDANKQTQGGSPPQNQQVASQNAPTGSQPTASVDKPQDAPQDDFPKTEKEQREAFYSMRKKIKDLETRDQQGQEDLNLIDLARSASPPNPNQAFTPQNIPQNNGMFDTTDPATQAFLNKAQKAELDAQAARQDAQRANAQLEDFEAWQKFPFLNPKSTKTEEQQIFADDVQKEYIAAKLKAVSQGKVAPRLVEVANKVQDRHEKIRSQAREQGKEEATNTQIAKSEATRESRGTQVNLQGEGQDIEALRRRVNRGDMDAQAELLKKTDPFLANWPE